MNSDFRIAVGFTTHRKTRRLIKRAGHEAVFCLLKIWTHCATKATDGVLDLDDEDIDDLVGWHGAEPLAPILVEIKFLDRIDTGVQVHNWAVHNPYCANTEERLRAAKESGRRGGLKSAEVRKERYGTAQPVSPEGSPKGAFVHSSRRVVEPPIPSHPNISQEESYMGEPSAVRADMEVRNV